MPLFWHAHLHNPHRTQTCAYVFVFENVLSYKKPLYFPWEMPHTDTLHKAAKNKRPMNSFLCCLEYLRFLNVKYDKNKKVEMTIQ